MDDWKEALARLGAALPPAAPEETPEEKPAPARHAGAVRISIDRRMRRGKTATLIEGFGCPEDEVAEIASELKRRLGCGGSNRGADILLQGDRRAEAAALLGRMGYRVTGV